MHKETLPAFTKPWMKRLGIKPIVVDLRTMDIEGGTFIEELRGSLRAGYDPARPIIVATSDDERADGQVIDGRHRLYVLDQLKERGITLPSPFPLGKVEVKDLDHLRALIASYEQRGRSKGAKYVKAHIEHNLKGIIQDHPEQGKNISKFIMSLGFSNESIIHQIVDDYQGPTKKGKPKRKVRYVSRGLPESVAGAWPSTESVYAGRDERLDLIISFHNCPKCKTTLKISNTEKGECVLVEAVPVIAK